MSRPLRASTGVDFILRGGAESSAPAPNTHPPIHQNSSGSAAWHLPRWRLIGLAPSPPSSRLELEAVGGV